MKLARHDSDTLKGWAILLMVIHHVLGFPDRFPQGLEPAALIPGTNLGLSLGLFSKICVASFLFLSGYGMGAKPVASLPAALLHRLLNFYGLFLANFVLVVTALWILLPVVRPVEVPWTPPRDLGWASLLKNGSLISVSLVQEWWFAKLYVLSLILIYPLLEGLERWGKAWLIPLISALLWLLGEKHPVLSWVLSYQTVFTLGFLLARHPDRLECLQPASQWLGTRPRQLAIGLLLLAACIALRSLSAPTPFVSADIALVPLCLYAFLLLTRALKVSAVLQFLGLHSSSIWLVHTVLCYHLFWKAYYSLHHPVLIVAAVLASSLLVSMLTMPLIRLLTDRLKRLADRILPMA